MVATRKGLNISLSEPHMDGVAVHAFVGLLPCLSATDCHPYPRRQHWWSRAPKQITHQCQLPRQHHGAHFAKFDTWLGISYAVCWVAGESGE